MAGHNYAMFGWSWTEASVLGSQVFGRALMKSCNEGKEDRNEANSGFTLSIRV